MKLLFSILLTIFSVTSFAEIRIDPLTQIDFAMKEGRRFNPKLSTGNLIRIVTAPVDSFSSFPLCGTHVWNFQFSWSDKENVLQVFVYEMEIYRRGCQLMASTVIDDRLVPVM